MTHARVISLFGIFVRKFSPCCKINLLEFVLQRGGALCVEWEHSALLRMLDDGGLDNRICRGKGTMVICWSGPSWVR